MGPDHSKVFTVEVLAGNSILGRGSGRSKRAAEMEAAREALETLSGGQ
jgi:ribonuclease-3